MNKSKVIFHIDIDSFFVSAEVAFRPELKNKDIAISNNNSNSIVSALSYSAKQKGAKVPMKLKEARNYCDDLIVLKPNYQLYQELSKRILKYFRKNYSLKIEQASIDEWFIDVTHLKNYYSSPKILAIEIRDNVLKKFNVNISIGISYNKFLAKISTELAKPNGIFQTKFEDLQKIIWPLDISFYIGIGKTLNKLLRDQNINSIGDIAKIDRKNKNLNRILKNQINVFIDNANGIGDDEVIFKEFTKSIGSQITIFDNEFLDIKKIYYLVNRMSNKLANELFIKKLTGNGIKVSIKYADKKFFSISKKFIYEIDESKEIYKNAIKLFNQLWNEEKISMIGISIIGIKENKLIEKNISLFDIDKQVIKSEKNDKIQAIINYTNEKIKSNKLKLMNDSELN